MKRVLLICLLALLQGCDGAGFLAAHVGMALVGLTQIRPDRIAKFRVDVLADAGRTVSFRGEIECFNRDNLHGSTYQSAEDEVEVEAHGTTWVLNGIGCEPLSPHAPKSHYTVYEVTEPGVVNVIFLAVDDPRVVVEEYEWGRYTGFSFAKPPRPGNPRFATGPFAFERYTLRSIPAPLVGVDRPTQLYSSAVRGCDQESEVGGSSLKLPHHELERLIQDTDNVDSVERGTLGYDSSRSFWTLVRSAPDSPRLTAVNIPEWERANWLYWPTCITVSTPDGVAMTGSVSDFTYFPGSKSLIRVALVSHNQYRDWVNGDKRRSLWLY